LDFLVTHAPILIVALPLVAAFVIPLISMSRGGDRWRNIFSLAIFAFIAFLVAILVQNVHAVGIRIYTFGATTPELSLPHGYTVPVRIIFEVDGMSVFMGIIVTTVAFAALIYSLHFMKGQTGQARFYALMFLLYAAMMGLAFTGDMFNLFVFLEIASIAGAGLAAYRTNMADAIEGGFKYIVISAISALLVLFAIHHTGHDSAGVTGRRLCDKASRCSTPHVGTRHIYGGAGRYHTHDSCRKLHVHVCPLQDNLHYVWRAP
jgi:multicomponent Na+:H+ antiporter subunit D